MPIYVVKAIRKVIFAVSLLFLSVLFGTFAYMYLVGADFLPSLYMAVITVSTVGYSEVVPIGTVERVFTIIYILINIGLVAYLVTNFTAFFLDDNIYNSLKQHKMEQRIRKLKNHVIVCGFGRTGEEVAFDLHEAGEQVVIIERREVSLEHLKKLPHLFVIVGDATLNHHLEDAGIRNAKGLICCTPSDADNVFVVLSANELNPNLKIISRASSPQSVQKLKKAGADNVIMPEILGGRHMAKLISQPDLLEFLDDLVIKQSESRVFLTELACDFFSSEKSRTLGDLDVGKRTGANIIGIKTHEGAYHYNPDNDCPLSKVKNLFVMGTAQQVEQLKKILFSESKS